MPNLTETGCKGIDDLLGKQGPDFVADWLMGARQQATTAKKQKTAAGGVTFLADETGVKAKDADDNTTVVSSPLWIEAITRDEHAANFGRLLRFVDPDGNEKQWAMPASLLSGDKATYEGYLRDQGVDIFHSKHLHTYLASKPESGKRVLVVSRTGWHRGVFVFADECIGSDDGEGIFHQSPEGSNHLLRTAGTLAEWQHEVARYCPGNSRLTLAVCAGFASTLLGKLNVEGGGFHLRGGTSTGKTTALLVGGSVWGGGSDKGFLRRWRATINGLESVAASHNDALLCLDELAEVDPYQAGETAYMLANGQGKIRQTKSITLRRPLEWRTLFLSSGEISLADHLATVNKRARGGMEVRLVDLPADAGQGLGLFEELHGFTTGKELSDHLQEASKRYFGTAARAFINHLVQQSESDLRNDWQSFKSAFLKMVNPADAKEEAGRVCDRFALVAFAGEMATESGITGWNEGEATNAASLLFKEWLSQRGTGRSDEEAALQQVRLFLEQHSDSRFRRLGGGDERTIINQAGYVERNDDGEITTWYILPGVFQSEVCKGYDSQQVATALKAREWLHVTRGLQCEKKVDGVKHRTYAVKSTIFE
jgi:putative DNA primase/helicase